jgi:hypothetical protein
VNTFTGSVANDSDNTRRQAHTADSLSAVASFTGCELLPPNILPASCMMLSVDFMLVSRSSVAFLPKNGKMRIYQQK